MRAIASILLLLLAACGGEAGATATVRVRATDEAVVTFEGEYYGVVVTNEGPSPIEVLWPTRLLDITLPPQADSMQRLTGSSAIRIRCGGEAGASVRLVSEDASGVRQETRPREP